MPLWLAALIAVAAITTTCYIYIWPDLRRRGRAGNSSSVQDADLDARSATPRQPRLRLFIGVAVAVAIVAVVGHCAPILSGPRVSGPPHALLSSQHTQFSVTAEQAHLVDGPSTACHESATAAVLPRPGTASVARGAVTAVIRTTGWLAQPAVVAGRRPPRALSAVLTGQHLLTRFCRARR